MKVDQGLTHIRICRGEKIDASATWAYFAFSLTYVVVRGASQTSAIRNTKIVPLGLRRKGMVARTLRNKKDVFCPKLV